MRLLGFCCCLWPPGGAFWPAQQVQRRCMLPMWSSQDLLIRKCWIVSDGS